MIYLSVINNYYRYIHAFDNVIDNNTNETRNLSMSLERTKYHNYAKYFLFFLASVVMDNQKITD